MKEYWLDPPEATESEVKCEHCDNNFYVGEDAKEFDDMYFHPDCLVEWVLSFSNNVTMGKGVERD